MKKKLTSMSAYMEDVQRLRKLRRLREKVPKKKTLRGRYPSDMEIMPEVFKRAVDALEVKMNE